MEEEVNVVNYSELHDAKLAEMKEKYKEAVYDLADKNGVDVGVGFDMLKSICEVELHPDDPEYPALYHTDVELNMDELLADYIELKELSDKCREARGLESV